MSKEELHLEKTSSSQDVTNPFQSLPFESIIGNPMKEVTKEQEKASQEYWDYIKQIGFDDKKGETK